MMMGGRDITMSADDDEDGCMDGWMDGSMDGWIDGWDLLMDEQTDG